MDMRRKDGSGRPTFSLDLPSTPPSMVIRPRCNTDRKLVSSNTLPPIPGSPTTAILTTQPFFKGRNLSVATLACPPSSLHPSILQRLELAMADDPIVEATKPPASAISAASIASSLSDHSIVDDDDVDDVDNDTWSLPSTPLPPATSPAPVFLRKLDGGNGVRRMRRRTSETDVAACRRDNYHMPGPSQLGSTAPYSPNTASGIVYEDGIDCDGMNEPPSSRSDKVIRFWSRLRRGGRSSPKQRQRKQSNASGKLTSAPPSTSATPVLSPVNSRSGRKIFSCDSSALSSANNGANSNGSHQSKKLARNSSKSSAPKAQLMAYSLSANAATIGSSAAVKETSKVVKEYDPRTGNKMLNQYMVVGDLGRGVHGKVKLARDTATGQSCAIKVVDKAVRRRYRMSQYGRMSRNGFGGSNSPNFVVAGSPELGAYSIKSGTGGNNGSSISAINMPSAAMNSEQPHLDKIRREIAILKKCRHPNVVRLIEVIDDPQARKIYLVLELLDGGEVRWKQPDADLPLLSQRDTRRIFRDVVLGLEYLHYQGIVHRDIKPANLLMTADSRIVKITDFGVSHLRAPRHNPADGEGSVSMARRLSHRTCSSGDSKATLDDEDEDDADGRWADDEAELAKTVGSPAFFAPELCYAGDDDWASATASSSPQMDNKDSPNTSNATAVTTSTGRPPVTKSIDIWALGVTLYCLVYGRCPFMAETEWELFSVIPRKELLFPDDVIVPPMLVDLLQRLLTKDPQMRITLAEVKRHPWVVEDLCDPEGWRAETDPAHFTQVDISDDDVTKAVTFKERLRDHFRRLSTSLGLRRKSRGTGQALGLPSSPPLPQAFAHPLHSPLVVDASSASSSNSAGGTSGH